MKPEKPGYISSQSTLLGALTVLHLEGQHPSERLNLNASPGYFCLQTCCRWGGVGWNLSKPLDPTMEVYRDIQALEFCLQWICGLLSPVVGETEIQGQFKQALTEQLDHLDSHLKKILLFVLKKSKEIRKHCLQGVSQGSYGHWVRKILSQESGPVLLVGAGQLATSLLPWIPNLAALTNRDLRRAKALLGLKSKVKHASVWEWFDWEQWMQANHLVFCVPGFAVDSENFWAFAQAWRLAHPQGWVIDLAEPPCFPSGFPGNYVDLKAAFRDLEHMRNRLQLSVSEAKQVIYQEALHYASTWQWVMPHTLMDIAPLIV